MYNLNGVLHYLMQLHNQYIMIKITVTIVILLLKAIQ